MTEAKQLLSRILREIRNEISEPDEFSFRVVSEKLAMFWDAWDRVKPSLEPDELKSLRSEVLSLVPQTTTFLLGDA